MLLLALVVGPGRAGAGRPCGGVASDAVLSAAGVQVYRTGAGSIRACGTRSGRELALGDQRTSFVFEPPAMAASAGLLAYGTYVEFDVNETDNTSIEVVDLNGPRESVRRRRSYPAGATYGIVRVIHMVLRPSGAAIWTSCASARIPPAVARFRGTRCPRPAGNGIHPVTAVRLAFPSGGTRTLAQNDRIDPTTLRLRGDTVTWRESGRLRTFSLKSPRPRCSTAWTNWPWNDFCR
ncbi:hypothetical protein [Paraconexibacter sp. AEG42_29]|uniref:hypothetical protein n=1 Tax=Paraconexibacter sp. AEG42_29 TaxID=2997339 RepID=UPI00339D4B3B